MSRTLAAEWAKYNIRVNTIAPGPFRSEGTDRNLWPTEEIRSRVTGAIPLARSAARSAALWR